MRPRSKALLGLAVFGCLALLGLALMSTPPQGFLPAGPLERARLAHSTQQVDLKIDEPVTGIGPNGPPAGDRPDSALHEHPDQPPAEPKALHQEYDDLSKRADAGDKQAACELAASLDLCWRNSRAHSQVEWLERTAAARDVSSQTENTVDWIAELEAQLDRSSTVCAGLTGTQLAQAWKYQALAADLGDSEASLRLLTAPPLDPARVLDQIEGWHDYITNYRQRLEALAATGNVPATVLLQGFYAGTERIEGVTNQPIQPDLYEATVLALVLSNVNDPRLTLILEGNTLSRAAVELNPARYAQAQVEAARLVRTAFQNTDFSSPLESLHFPFARDRDTCD